MSTATTSTTTWAAVAALGLISAVVLVGGAMSLDAAPVLTLPLTETTSHASALPRSSRR